MNTKELKVMGPDYKYIGLFKKNFHSCNHLILPLLHVVVPNKNFHSDSIKLLYILSTNMI